MSFQEFLSLSSQVAHFAPFPALGAAVSIVAHIYERVDHVKVCRRQCRDLCDRCTSLLLAFRDSSNGMEGTRALELMDEVEATINRVHSRVNAWAEMNSWKSVLQQNNIKEGIDRFYRDIDGCMMKFNVYINMELYRGHRDLRASHERDRTEFRDILYRVVPLGTEYQQEGDWTHFRRSPNAMYTPSSPQFPSRGGSSPASLQTSVSIPRDLDSHCYQSRSHPPTSSTSLPLPVLFDEGILEQAVDDPTSLVREASDGSVLAGTLQGLIERLISDLPDVRRNTEYRDIFLTTYVAFTTADNIFKNLVRKFNETNTRTAELQARICFNIIVVMKHWLASPHIEVDIDVLLQMRAFALSIKASKYMTDLAKNVAERIDVRIHAKDSTMSSLMSKRVSIPGPADISPRGLAIALTVMEGDSYHRLFPSDYIVHLLRPSSSTNIVAACETHNKIIYWVKRSILIPEEFEVRAEVFKFFINTALECRQLRNFSSMAAIVGALESSCITRLTVTRRVVQETSDHLLVMLSELSRLIQDVPHHRPYHDALDETKDPCVPWIAVHLLDLNAVFRKHSAFVKFNGRPLINFVRSIEFNNQIKKLLQYKTPPNTELDHSEGSLAYLESQLLNSGTEDALEERSLVLASNEKRIHHLRVLEFKSLGFRT